MKRFLLLATLLVLAAFAMPASSAFAELVPVGDLLFRDTYNYGDAPFGDVNTGINDPGRVSGPLAGQVAYDQANSAGGMDIDGPNDKFDLSDYGAGVTTARLGLTKDFNNELALGGLTVCAKVLARAGYAGIGAGHSGSSASSIGDLFAANWASVPGFYFNAFATDNVYGLNTSAFGSDGTNALTVSPSNFTLGAGYGDYVELGIVFTDTDNNPFNGSGTLTAAMYIDGTLVGTATGPDLAHNFISFQTNTTNYNSFQDLRVYGNAAAVPEPSVLALLASAAGLAFVWFRRRR
jgi:hypothetical protein